MMIAMRRLIGPLIRRNVGLTSQSRPGAGGRLFLKECVRRREKSDDRSHDIFHNNTSFKSDDWLFPPAGWAAAASFKYTIPAINILQSRSPRDWSASDISRMSHPISNYDLNMAASRPQEKHGLSGLNRSTNKGGL